MQSQQFTTAPTLEDAVNRYIETVCPLHKGQRWEAIRLRKFLCYFDPKKELSSFRPRDFSAWRDRRLKEVKPASVAREMTLLSSVFEEARREWEWCQINPLRSIRKPSSAHHRERIISSEEIDQVIEALGYIRNTIPRLKKHEVAVIFLIALETGMRSSEICGLTWEHVLFDKQCFYIPTSKNGHSRKVPMLGASRELIELMRRPNSTGQVFSVSSSSRDAIFRKARKQTHLSGFTFHDGRHTAATRIAGKLGSGEIPAQQALLDLCKILGWADVNRSLTYYNPSASEIIARFNIGHN